MLKQLLEEPLVHFMALALVILAAYGLLNRDRTEAPDRVLVTASKIEQLASLSAKNRAAAADGR